MGAGTLLLRPRAWTSHYKRAHEHAALMAPGFRPRANPVQHRLMLSASKLNPNYNKYRSRQAIENDNSREWAQTTALTKNHKLRQPTLLSTLASLPFIIKYYVVPGPLRYIWFYVWQTLLGVMQQIWKRLILQGSKLEVALRRRAGMPDGVQRRMVLLRFHGRIPPAEELKYWLSLLQGKSYSPQLTDPEFGSYGPNYMPAGYVELIPGIEY